MRCGCEQSGRGGGGLGEDTPNGPRRRSDNEGEGEGRIGRRKIGKKIRAKMRARQGKGVPRREAGMPREKEWEGAGSGRGRLAPFHS